MDSNISSPADTAVATMRTLPWTSSQSTSSPRLKTARGGALAFTVGSDQATGMPTAATYRHVDVDAIAPCVAIDLTIALAWGINADHKFSTRLGPPPRPPV